MRSHFGHLLVYSGIVAAFFAVLTRRDRTDQIKFLAWSWLAMTGGVLLLAYLMLPFPR
ncbi:MAG TPA: hypothetical protein VFV19_14415 [Candidatus Polarisedimenticolaceae bacterium]|nr:hypothetical protein [Candidatus Polarisedimenticolaceae bacterium]